MRLNNFGPPEKFDQLTAEKVRGSSPRICGSAAEGECHTNPARRWPPLLAKRLHLCHLLLVQGRCTQRSDGGLASAARLASCCVEPGTCVFKTRIGTYKDFTRQRVPGGGQLLQVFCFDFLRASHLSR